MNNSINLKKLAYWVKLSEKYKLKINIFGGQFNSLTVWPSDTSLKHIAEVQSCCKRPFLRTNVGSAEGSVNNGVFWNTNQFHSVRDQYSSVFVVIPHRGADDSLKVQDCTFRSSTQFSLIEMTKIHSVVEQGGFREARFRVSTKLGDPEVSTGANTVHYGSSARTLVLNNNSPYYNYLDVGHYLVYVHNFETNSTELFITDKCNLPSLRVALLTAIVPSIQQSWLQDGVFLRAGERRVNQIIFAAESEARKKTAKTVPSIKAYELISANALKAFSDRVVTDALARLVEEKTGVVTAHGIQLNYNRANYNDLVTVEADETTANIFEQVLANIPSTDSQQGTAYDIYELVDQFCKAVCQEVYKKDPEVHYSFKINQIPIKVRVDKKSRRCLVNEVKIRFDELDKVLRQAVCLHNVEDYYKFLKQVQHMSLMAHTAVAQGLPLRNLPDGIMYDWPSKDLDIKMGLFEAGRCPRIKVQYNKRRYYLEVPGASGEEPTLLKIDKFSEFIYKFNDINERSARVIWPDRYLELMDSVLKKYTGMSDSCFARIQEVAAFAHKEAIAKSFRLLSKIEKELHLKDAVFEGIEGAGYLVKGTSGREYVVQKEPPFKVYSNDKYICIVNRTSDMGVGVDPLIARLMALKNDSVLAEKISTLQK